MYCNNSIQIDTWVSIFVLYYLIIAKCGAVDLTFVVDSSGSITNDKWDSALQFMVQIVEKMAESSDDLRFGCVVFSNYGYLEFRLDEYNETQAIMDRIEKIEYRDGNTNTSGGLLIMIEDVFQLPLGDRPDVPNLGLVITDGKSTRDEHLTIPYASRAKAEGIALIAMGIGPDVDRTELEGIATTPEQVIQPETYNQLDLFAEYLVNQACDIRPAGMHTSFVTSCKGTIYLTILLYSKDIDTG